MRCYEDAFYLALTKEHCSLSRPCVVRKVVTHRVLFRLEVVIISTRQGSRTACPHVHSVGVPRLELKRGGKEAAVPSTST